MQYAQAVHFQDANGDWQEFDNSLVDAGASYVPRASDLGVSLPKELGESSRITMFDAEVVLAIGVPEAASEAIVLNAEDIVPEDAALQLLQDSESDTIPHPIAFANKEIQTVRNQRSVVYYPNAFPGADLQYIVETDKLKENVIVHEKQDEYVYRFALNLNNLTAVPQKDGSIQLIDSKTAQPKFMVEAPYAFDANGEIAEDVLTLAVEGDTLILTADTKWMNAKERAFPVVLDPTYAHIFDASSLTAVSLSPQWGRLAEIEFKLRVGVKTGVFNTTNQFISCIRFDLPTLPGDAVVTNAALVLDANTMELRDKIASWFRVLIKEFPKEKIKDLDKVNIGAYQITSAWSGLTSWSNRPQANYDEALCLGELIDSGGNEVTKGHRYSFDITRAVNDWVNGDANYGIMLKAVDEKNTKDNYLEFASLRAYFPVPILLPGKVGEDKLDNYNVLIALPLLDENFQQLVENGVSQWFVLTYDLNLPILINIFNEEPLIQINYICTTYVILAWRIIGAMKAYRWAGPGQPM